MIQLNYGKKQKMASKDEITKLKENTSTETDTSTTDQENVQRDLIITEIETSDGNLGASLR